MTTTQHPDLAMLMRQAPEPPSEATRPRPLRGSALGKCARALAYRVRGEPQAGRTTTQRSRNIFGAGDDAEVRLVRLLQRVLPEGWRLVGTLEDQVKLTTALRVRDSDDAEWVAENHAYINTDRDWTSLWVEVAGSPDGLLLRPDGTTAVLEVKTMNDNAFRRVERALRAGVAPWGPEEGYYWQAQAYLWADWGAGMRALGLVRFDGSSPPSPRETYVVAMNKNSGHLLGWWLDQSIVARNTLEQHVTTALAASVPGTENTAPRRLPGGQVLRPKVVMGKRGKPIAGHGKLPWQCAYCAHYRPCWGPLGLEERVERNALALYVPPERVAVELGDSLLADQLLGAGYGPDLEAELRASLAAAGVEVGDE